MRVLANALLIVLGMMAAGCATLTKGTSQTVTVGTDPAGAICTLTRDGKTVAIVNPTPGSVPVDKAQGTITVLCTKEKFEDASGAMASEFQAMTFGNILLGGIIGVVVDAASGAMHQYPDAVTITMVPVEFPSIPERDAFFDRLLATLNREVAELKERIRKKCRADQCEAELNAATRGAETQANEIERRRSLAKVAET
jgi:hypothetical protein